ncbi:MAG: gliding motility-associated C-terminal domain-containing protein [Vicingaceae bacterium]
MRKILLLTLLWGFSLSAFATHNRAGEITYRHVSGLTYEFTITIYADGNSPAIARKDIEVDWGDNLGRDSLIVILEDEIEPDRSIIKRVWRGNHTFPGPGTYSISISDPNRNSGVDNINNSVQVPFYLETQLRISPLGNLKNNSPQLLNSPIDEACVGQPFVHNPGAYDPDGDSLAYEIAKSRGLGGTIAPGFYYPSNMSVNPLSGDLSWTNPDSPAMINVAILIKEYRNGVLLGSILRDIQIQAFPGCNNRPPNILSKQEYCVEANKTLVAPIQGSDPESNQKVSLSATGGPFEVDNNPADFNNSSPSNPTYASFVWNTLCEHVKVDNYTVSIRAEDNGGTNGSVNLTSYKTLNVKVIAPAPQNFTAEAKRTNIELNWDNGSCNEAEGYSIYRRVDSSGFVPDSCMTGVPEGIGYEKIATINNVNNTTFLDENEGEGLVPGRKYCYLIHSFFSDGAESYASAEVCAEILKVSPVMTKVSIDSTDSSEGVVQLAWSPPDSINPGDYPPPYRYLIYQEQNGVFNLIDSTLSLVDTTYILNNQNTVDQPHNFFVELWSYGSGRLRVSQAVKSSSVFLNLEASDRQIQLSWNANVAWREDSFIIHRKAPNASSFTPIDTVFGSTYLDTGLTNEEDYCYLIESRGSYNLSSVNLPLINFSQEVCEQPVDNVPPCPPIFRIESDCESDDLKILWKRGEGACKEDLQAYRIFYSPTLDGELEQIAEVSGSSYEFIPDLAKNSGCYSVVAVDTVGNLSEMPEKICRDYCPYFELPNIFTPNGDGVNDLFEPIPPNNNPATPNFRDVDSIDLKIYNRWQQLVFETHKPEVKWDGFHQKEEKMLKDGVYYYHCVVYERSLSGINPRTIQGTVTLRDGDENFRGTYK